MSFAFLPPAAQAVDCTVPISGNMTISSSCSFTGTTNGVDAGTGTSNTASLTLSGSATLTVSAGQTIAAGSLIPSAGSIAIVSGGQIKPGAPLWMYDADADGYAKESTMAAQATADPGFRRRNLMTSMTTRDCRDFYGSGITCDPATMNMTDGTHYGSYQEAAGTPAGGYRELPADESTVGLWHMNEGTGTTTVDSSGNSYTGTLTNGPTWNTAANSKLGASSLSFDGVNDFVNVGDRPALNITDAITVEGWVKLNELNRIQTIERKWLSYLLEYSAGTGFCNCARFAFYNGTAWQIADGTTVLQTGKWYHLAGVFDGSTAKIYVDGVLEKSTATTGKIQVTTNGLLIGWDPYINGSIDEVRISNVARTPEEIKAAAQRAPYASYIGPTNDLTQTPGSWSSLNFTAKGMKTSDGETPASTTGLVAAWNFNETSLTTAASGGSCGAACNGTLTNFASTASQDQAAGTGWTANNRRWGAGALMFDGATSPNNDYVTCTDANCGGTTRLDGNGTSTTGWTVEAWIKPTKSNATEALVAKYDPDAGQRSYMLYLSGGTPTWLACSAVTCGDPPSKNVSASSAVQSGNWYHIVGVYDGSNSRIYVNGKQENSVAYSSGIVDSTAAFTIGDRPSQSIPFNGVIDSTRIYSRALTAAEILANYQAGNIEFQTRTSADNATWEAWKPVTSEAALDAVDDLSPVQKISTTSLVSYWNLDETSGTRADSKGANTLTDNATVTYAPGRLSNAADFESGNSEYLSITDNSDLSMGDIDFSIGAWVKFESISGFMSIVAKWETTGNNREYELAYSTASSRFEFLVSNDGTNSSQANSTFGAAVVDTWYFVQGYHDSVNNLIGISVNSGPVDTTSYSSGGRDGTSSLIIGARSNPAGQYWDGLIDEVAFWKRTLTAAERTRLFEDGLDLHGAGSGRVYRTRDTTTKIEGTASEKLSIGSPQVDASTRGLWRFEETSGNANDSSGLGNTLTATGSPGVADGFFGKARTFDGSTQYFLCTDANCGGTSKLEPNQTTGVSFGGWIKTNSLAANQALTQKSGAGERMIQIGTDGSIRAEMSNLGCTGDSGLNNQGAGTIKVGRWHYLVVTVSAANPGVLKTYVDGNLIFTSGSTAYYCDSAADFYIGSNVTSEEFNGTIDEYFISASVRSAEEIAESFRAGRDHRLTKTISSTDLSLKSKVPFYVAADRPGTYLEATIGESAYANYEPDANTVGLWHLEEQTGSGAYIKDSSSLGNNLSVTSAPTFVQGKIGKGRKFDGTDDVLSCTDANCGSSSKLDYGGSGITVEAWVKTTISGTASKTVAGKRNSTLNTGYDLMIGDGITGKVLLITAGTSPNEGTYSNTAVNDGNWHYIVGTHNGSVRRIYVDGKLDGETTGLSGNISDSDRDFGIGGRISETTFIDATIDEVRISNTARTADEIRQAYEVGRRTHPITIDFAAKGDAGNLIANSTDYSFTVDATAFGAQNKGDNLFMGDKVIVRENVGGTEYSAQGTVNSVTASTGAVTVSAWDSGGTFPTGGYTANSHFFKWQREYFDLNGSLGAQRDAVTRLTVRVTNGHEGRTVWLDDFRSASYLADNTPDSFDTATGVGTYSVAGASIGSTYNRYIQTRSIFSSWDPAVSATLVSSSVEYGL